MKRFLTWLQGAGIKWLLLVILLICGGIGAALYALFPIITVGFMFAALLFLFLNVAGQVKFNALVTQNVAGVAQLLAAIAALVNRAAGNSLPQDKSKLN